MVLPPWLRANAAGHPRAVRQATHEPAIGRAYELEIVPGLEPIVADEVRERLGRVARPADRAGRLSLRHPGAPSELLALRTVVAVHALARFDVLWPGALLEPPHLPRLVALAGEAIALHPPGSFATLRISAAGADSPELTRLAVELAAALGLTPTRDAAHLSLGLRRGARSANLISFGEQGSAVPGRAGAPLRQRQRAAGDVAERTSASPDANPGPPRAWEALVRLSPKPLSARAWRVCNLPGALHATVASAIARLAGPRPDERVLNLACGSATLLIERLALGPAAVAVGLDVAPSSLDCATANLRAARFSGTVRLLQGDAASLPFPEAAFDTAVADLPYGMLVGRPEANVDLYPAALAETARVVVPGGGFVAVTASARLFERAMDRSDDWSLERSLRLAIPFARGYVKPTLYLLRRR